MPYFIFGRDRRKAAREAQVQEEVHARDGHAFRVQLYTAFSGTIAVFLAAFGAYISHATYLRMGHADAPRSGSESVSFDPSTPVGYDELNNTQFDDAATFLGRLRCLVPIDVASCSSQAPAKRAQSPSEGSAATPAAPSRKPASRAAPVEQPPPAGSSPGPRTHDYNYGSYTNPSISVVQPTDELTGPCVGCSTKDDDHSTRNASTPAQAGDWTMQGPAPARYQGGLANPTISHAQTAAEPNWDDYIPSFNGSDR